ncbi:MAG: EAL domain-containing protein [Halomonadaceae bacterium]|nr:MAG: EAL domain-containing protein [Halomonadaceae bacterium]
MARIRDRLTQFKARSPLSFRLLAYILVCSSLFTLVATAIQLYSDYRQEVSQVDERMALIETSYISSLSSSVWALDQSLLEIQLEGILSLPDIEHLTLIVNPDSELTLGQQPEDSATIEHSFDLMHGGAGTRQHLGTLTIVASMEGIYRNLQRKLFLIMATQGMKTFVLSFLIIFIFQQLVTRHLAAMANYARNFNLQDLPRPLTLDRTTTRGNRHDELAQVNDAINHMRTRLREDQQRLSADAREIRKLSLAIEQSPSSVLICNRHWRIEYANRKFSQITGHNNSAIIGKHPGVLTTDTLSNQESQQLWENIRIQVERAGVWQGELHSSRANGERFWEQVIVTPLRDDQGNPSNYLILGEDVSIRKRYEQQLLRQANYDILTGLPNRMLALDRLKLSLAQARRNHELVGVMFLDLDNFKHINDTLGHDAGDALLMEASRRVSSCLRGSSTVARLGGDEFLVILPELVSPEASELVANRILDAFHLPFYLTDQEVFITTSIGIALFPEDADNSSSLLQYADAAMYEAKNKGKSAFQRFSPEMKEVTHERLQMDNLLRRSLELAEFELHYQPIVDFVSNRVIGAEALLRWHNPTLGLVMPDRFIPLAEETGMIIPIGRWVLNEACNAVSRWQMLTREPLSVAVNVSARQFRDPSFVAMVESALQENQLAGHHLELEITERLILDNTLETSDILRQLDELGVRLSVDDFGTGYSALGYLKSYPFDTLKIDKSFVQDLISEPDDAALVKAIITMAHSLELQVVAEGVETVQQKAFLQQLECDYAQGYLFSPPAPEADFVTWLEAHFTSQSC